MSRCFRVFGVCCAFVFGFWSALSVSDAKQRCSSKQTCQKGTWCYPPGRSPVPSCGPQPPNHCNADRECKTKGKMHYICGPAYGCMGRSCRPGCVKNSQCAKHQMCRKNRCVPKSCRRSRQCPVDFICRKRRCQRKRCRKRRQCRRGGHCVSGQCYRSMGTCYSPLIPQP